MKWAQKKNRDGDPIKDCWVTDGGYTVAICRLPEQRFVVTRPGGNAPLAYVSSREEVLQHFGHHLYSPLATVRDQDVARTLVWFTWDKPAGMTKVKESRAYCLVLPALISYQSVVTGGRDEWTPGRIAEFVADWYGEKISVSQWARDWAPIWEGLQRTISDIDQRVLEPVELAIEGEREVA